MDTDLHKRKPISYIGKELAAKIDPPANDDASIHDYLEDKNKNCMFLSPTTEDEVIGIVKTCKHKTSTDSNDLSMSVIKKVIQPITLPLTAIFNMSFQTGVFPSSMKLAKIIPVFKSGSKAEFNNYRPISLLSQFSKILEKLYNKRLEQFIDKNNVLSNSQYGFRSSMSTSHALIDLVEEISESIDKKLYTLGVFIDFKKAFDTVNHSILLQKLNFYGIRGVAEKWIESYLSDRKQFVKICDSSSNALGVSCGVPQGSVLGPRLFILYINDICNVSKILKFVLFADDTNILYSDANVKNLNNVVNTELDKLNTWFIINKLSLNVSKTNYILFGNRKVHSDLDIKIYNNKITRVSETKFLGVWIDEKLNWKKHVECVKRNLSRVVGIIYRARHILGTETLLTLYYSLFLPILSYCCEIWGITYTSTIHCIEILQKRVIRLINGVNRQCHTNILFSRCRVLKFKDLVDLKVLLVLFKIFNSMPIPNNIQCLFNKSHRLRSSRSQCQYVRNCIRTNTKAHCLSTYGVKCWNSLPVNIVKIPTVHAFIQKLKINMTKSYN